MTSSRKKTLEHMQHLLAAASLAGGCNPPGTTTKDSGGTASTSTGYAVVDPMPPPAIDAGVIAPPLVPDAGASSKDAGKEGGKTAITMPTIEIKNTTPTVTAYGVVDPMPPPALRTK